MTKLSLNLISLLSLMTCSITWANPPRLLDDSPPNAPRLSLMSDQDDSSTPNQGPSLILVDQEKLQLLMEHDRKCVAFAGLCQERVMLLEAAEEDAKNVIKSQEEKVYVCNQDLASEKSKKTVIIPVVSVLLGLVAGFLITR